MAADESSRIAALNDEIAQLRRALVEREEQLQHAYSRATVADRRKEELLALLGHELRNPLAPIVTALQLMKLSGDSVHVRERAVIERQVGHLSRLVEDLLDISRITRGKLELKKERFALQNVIARAVEMASPLLEKRSHSLQMVLPDAPAFIEGDEIRIAQVFHNLLTNAAKYTPHGGRIAIRAAVDAAGVTVTVRDDGEGIPKELLRHIWEPFVQGNWTLDRAEGGLGIGLTLVRRLIDLHGGRVSARSEGEGKGSEFEVWLPAARSQSPSVVAVPEPVERTGAPFERRRILIVDDNQDAAETLGEFLETVGHEVRLAHDGPAGLAVGVEMAPDVAILDIGLPVMDGYELARKLRAQLGDRIGTIIAVTGYGQEGDRAASEDAGFAHHVVKPVDLDVLLRLIDGLPPARPASGTKA